jgi:hypothetical protein
MFKFIKPLYAGETTRFAIQILAITAIALGITYVQS